MATLHITQESDEECQISNPSPHATLADLLAAHGIPLNTRCGQRGLCKGCEVELRDGSLLDDGQTIAAPATIKSCRAKADESATIFVPSRSRIEHRPQVGETFEIAVPYAHQPLFLATPDQCDTAFAVDIGTTTVVVLLVDLLTGEVLSRAGGFNAQIRFGDNVLTRIEAAEQAQNLQTMQQAVVMETIQPLLRRCCERAERSLERIAGGAIGGNTTMLHLLVGENPSSLGTAPFSAQFLEGRQFPASTIGLLAAGLAPETPLQVLPSISAYIGADITASIYASGMLFDTKPSLMIDIGTNGEIVLQRDGQLTACATAAGPAFEGCGLHCGTRAREGAVSDLQLQLNPFEITVSTVGDIPLARANGLCGSAYIDFLATGKSCGLLSATGRFTATAWQQLPEQNRLSKENGRALRLTTPNGVGELHVSEVDVALLMQAKAAIGAGIETLLDTAGLRAEDLERVYLAGGFGMHLNVANAIAIGLLPGFREDQIRVVGNTALAGALLALVDRTVLLEMEALRSQVEVIELNLAEGFEDCYVDHLMLP